MARRIIVPRVIQGSRPLTHREVSPPPWDAVIAAASALEPDEALLVTREGVPTDLERLIGLRNQVRVALHGLGLACLPDVKNGGVWVYKPGPGMTFGTRVRLGPPKEAEILARPIDAIKR